MSEVLIEGGTVVDPDGSRRADVLVRDGVIVAVGDDLSADTVLDASDCVVSAGFVDLHTHLREPGAEEAETIESGSRGAVLGGYTTILAMPNTFPTIDNAAVVRDVRAIARSALCRVEVSAAMTIDRAGERLTEMVELAGIGVRWFTDDGTGLQDDHLMRRAMEYAAPLGVVLAQHAENTALSAGGVMHEGEWSSRLGLPGQPSIAEELMVMRDIALARATGGRVHIMHTSTAGSVEMVRAAKAEGLRVTAEVTPHHLSLTDAACEHYDPVFKVHPPLRTGADVAACRAGLADGTLDAVATDHAPHAPETKRRPFDEAPPGMLGLETAFAVVNTDLDLPIETLLDRFSWAPTRLLTDSGDAGHIRPGVVADITIIDTDEEWTVDADRTASRSRNTPFEGRRLRGRARHTLVGGEVVVNGGVPTR